MRYGRKIGAATTSDVERAKTSAASTPATISSPRPITPDIHDRAEAADNITDMPCQRPGSAWQNACSVRSGKLT